MADRQVALVTGGSRGIGKGIATALAGAGFDIVINHFDPDEAAAEQTRQDIEALGVRCRALRGDVSSAPDRVVLVDVMKREFGRLDLLVNNAGVAPLQRT